MNRPIASAERGNVEPILNEVVYALDRLLEQDETTVIDLASLPFGPGELERLDEMLGVGELTASLDALGKSRIRETRYPGVWRLDHMNTDGEVVGRYLEVTWSPDILRSQEPDVAAARARLADSLNTEQDPLRDD